MSIRICIFLIVCIYAHDVSASTVEQLEKRVKELEILVQQLLEHRDPEQQVTKLDTPSKNELTYSTDSLTTQVQTLSMQVEEQEYLIEETTQIIDNSMKLAGYADVEYKGSSESGIKEEFRMHHLSLFFTRQFDNNIKFFSEIEYEDAPKFDGVNDGSGDIDEASGTIFVEAMNFDWNYSQYANVRAGRFFTPAGIWSEDHYPPFVATQERPMHIFRIFPQFVDGVAGFGSAYISHDISFDYNMFLGNGESSISGKKDLNSNKATGFRGNFHFPNWDGLTAGFTYYNDNEDTANGNADKFAQGVHVKARYQNLSVQLEFAKADLEYADASLDHQREGFYAQFIYNLDNWALGYRYDMYDQNSTDIGKIKRQSMFVNYHVDQNITLKGEYHLNQYEDQLSEDFGFYIFSISTYLGR